MDEVLTVYLVFVAKHRGRFKCLVLVCILAGRVVFGDFQSSLRKLQGDSLTKHSQLVTFVVDV